VLGRRLDRYVGMFFAWHFILCLAAIVVLYIVIDTFANLEEFLGRGGLLPFFSWIVTYHAYQLPPLLTLFLPLVTLLAGTISVSRLARYNELNAIKAVGVSLHRALVPVFIGAGVACALTAANQELLVPALAPGIAEVRAKAPLKDRYKDIALFEPDTKSTIWVRLLEYGIPGFEVEGLATRPLARPARARKPDALRIRGARGVWVQRWIFLVGGEMQDAAGRWQPFRYKSLATDDDATVYPLPGKPGSAATAREPVRLAGRRRGVPVEITFSSWKHVGALRLMLDAQLTAPLRGDDAPAPIAIQAALWSEAHHAWLGRASTYRVVENRRDEIVYDADPLPFTVPPHELVKNKGDPTLKSFAELLRYKDASPALRQRLLVVLHSRVAFPLANLVLLLVAIPLLFQQEGGKSTWVGMGLAMLVSMAFYVTTYVFQLAGQEVNGIFAGVPALAAWLPVAIFATGGVALMKRMET